jgi:hypothetical protein
MAELSRLQQAQRNSDAARAKLAETLSEIEKKLNPRTLIREAVSEVRLSLMEMAGDAVGSLRAHPLKTLGAAASLAAFATQSPIGQTLMSLFLARKETSWCRGMFKTKK